MAFFKKLLRTLTMSVLDILVIVCVPLVWIARKIFNMLTPSLKVSIWTGAPILNMAKNCRSERQLGFRSISVVRTTYYITDEFDFVLDKLFWRNRFLSAFFTYFAFFLICITARQVHAYFDGGILLSRKHRQFNGLELKIYRLLGIRLFIWTYGADVRVRQTTLKLGEPNCCTDCTQVGLACICDDIAGRKNVNLVSKYATACFSMGDMIEYTKGSINNTFFWPVDLEANEGKRFQAIYPSSHMNEPLKIVHAPNHRMFKGTAYLESAIIELREEGVPIELVMVERVPNVEALKIYQTADVIFDQCLVGFHGYFALEAMALGKPVMCFIRKPEEYLLHANECPIINTCVETLKNDLRLLVEQRETLPEIGRRGRRYIEKYHSFEAFAGRLRMAYKTLGIFK